MVEDKGGIGGGDLVIRGEGIAGGGGFVVGGFDEDKNMHLTHPHSATYTYIPLHSYNVMQFSMLTNLCYFVLLSKTY